MTLHTIDVSKATGAPALWQEIVDASTEGWIWHTWAFHQFELCAGGKIGATDHSFFVYEGEVVLGVVPLIIQNVTKGVFTGSEAMSYSGPLPWPCFRSEAEPERRREIEDFAFTELERRAKKAGAGRISLMLFPPRDQGDERDRVGRVEGVHHYLSLPGSVQNVTVTSELLSMIQGRYDYKHFSPLFTLTIQQGPEVTVALEETYFALHVKDAGSQFRSRESYVRQADIVRKSEGFYVIARHKESDTIAGMALISCYKGAAYYASVAIDPDFQKLCVGYLLQCQGIEELEKRGISSYALGPAWDLSTWGSLTSDKQRAIAHFKDKFSRHQSRDMYQVEKFLDIAFFDASMREREEALRNYFAL